MKTKIKLMLLALVLPVFMAACSSSGGGSPSGSIVVQESGGSTIYILNASQSTDSNWGDDQLGSSIIGPYGTFTLTGVSPCDTYWDVRARYYSYDYEIYNVYVPCNGSITVYPY